MSLLLSEGADPDVATSSNGHTPLHNAASGGHVDAAEALIAAGGDLDAQNSGNGNTPLHIAASKGGPGQGLNGEALGCILTFAIARAANCPIVWSVHVVSCVRARVCLLLLTLRFLLLLPVSAFPAPPCR